MTPKRQGARRAHVWLDDATFAALDTISTVIRSQGGQPSTSAAVRFAALKVARSLADGRF